LKKIRKKWVYQPYYDAPVVNMSELLWKNFNGFLSDGPKDTLERKGTLYNLVELQQNVNKAILRLRQRLAQTNRIQTQERE
jgi:hypothetical protein